MCFVAWAWAAGHVQPLGVWGSYGHLIAEAGLVLGLIVAVLVIAGARGHCASYILHARRRWRVKHKKKKVKHNKQPVT